MGITAIYHQGRFYILDVCRERMEFLALRERVELLCNRYRVQRLLIERASSGEQLITMLTREPRPGVPIPIPCKPTDDKIVRFHAQASRVEGGQVLLPRSAPWLPDFLKEICGFPNSKFKDQADAFSQLLLHGALWTEPEDDSAPIIIDEETGYDDYDPSDPFAGWD